MPGQALGSFWSFYGFGGFRYAAVALFRPDALWHAPLRLRWRGERGVDLVFGPHASEVVLIRQPHEKTEHAQVEGGGKARRQQELL